MAKKLAAGSISSRVLLVLQESGEPMRAAEIARAMSENLQPVLCGLHLLYDTKRIARDGKRGGYVYQAVAKRAPDMPEPIIIRPLVHCIGVVTQPIALQAAA